MTYSSRGITSWQHRKEDSTSKIHYDISKWIASYSPYISTLSVLKVNWIHWSLCFSHLFNKKNKLLLLSFWPKGSTIISLSCGSWNATKKLCYEGDPLYFNYLSALLYESTGVWSACRVVNLWTLVICSLLVSLNMQGSQWMLEHIAYVEMSMTLDDQIYSSVTFICL